jgi:hypothetical protein
MTAMKRMTTRLLVLFSLLAFLGQRCLAQTSSDDSRRVVLVELFTSQGCDMCPDAERFLGQLAEKNPRVIPIAFHVDYFDKPWKDVYSNNLFSQRQAAYNQLYTKPKNPDYGLYYTPMMMVDGLIHANGRDPQGQAAAVQQALAVKPQVSLKASLNIASDGRNGEVLIKLASKSPTLNGRDTLVAAVLRTDRVVTKVESGENGGKALTARFPALAAKYESVLLATKATTIKLPLTVDANVKLDQVGVVVFAQDKKTGTIYQAAYLPWKSIEATP